jgi:hypothetical protein
MAAREVESLPPSAIAMLHTIWADNPKQFERLIVMLSPDQRPEFGEVTVTFHGGKVVQVEGVTRFR